MHPQSFDHRTNRAVVRFGDGRIAEIAAAADELRIGRAYVLASPSALPIGRRVAELLEGRLAGISGDARMHTPTSVTEDHVRRIADCRADGLISVGGGSAIGLAKAVAMCTDLAIICIPTTYSGSEMTSIWGATFQGRKTTGRDQQVMPSSVIYDPRLILDLPVSVAGLSGLNSLAHAVEAVYAPENSPLLRMMAADAIKTMHQGLIAISEKPVGKAADDTYGHALALRGAWLAGMCLGSATMSLHHKLCHVLGGTFDTPHAATHAVLLPHVLAYNSSALTADQHSLLSRTLDTPDPCTALTNLATRFGAPPSLQALGIRDNDVPAIVSQVVSASFHNPRVVHATDLQALLADALHGKAAQWSTPA